VRFNPKAKLDTGYVWDLRRLARMGPMAPNIANPQLHPSYMDEWSGMPKDAESAVLLDAVRNLLAARYLRSTGQLPAAAIAYKDGAKARNLFARLLARRSG
jgi:hypothetical protein